MPSFHGNTSGFVLSTAYDVPAKIKSFSLVNRAVGAVTVNVYIVYASAFIAVIPYNKSLAAGEAYIYSGEGEVNIPANYQIALSVSGSVDYHFSIE